MKRNTPFLFGDLDARDALLFDYVRGALDEAMTMLAASYASINERAAESLREWECLAGALFEELDAAPVSDACRKHLFERLDAAHETPPAKSGDSVLPPPLRAYTKCDCGDLDWKRYERGVEHIELSTARQTPSRAELMRMHPGAQAPEHKYSGYEYTLILDGFLLDDGRALKRGDLVIYPEGERHKPSACDQRGCIALIVTEVHGLPDFLQRLFKAW